MTIIWGYTSDDENVGKKLLDRKKEEIKQVFSAFLFQSGFIGIAVELDNIIIQPQAHLLLIVDDKEISENFFSPKNSGIYTFKTEETIFPKSKIEVILQIWEGAVTISTSALGNGMGYIKEQGKFIPTQHFALGLVLD